MNNLDLKRMHTFDNHKKFFFFQDSVQVCVVNYWPYGLSSSNNLGKSMTKVGVFQENTQT